MESLRYTLKLLCLVLFIFSDGECNSFKIPRLGTRRRTNRSLHSSTSSPKTHEILFYTQRLDHFNYGPESYTTFQQRYLIDDTHWGGAKSRAPIFAYLGEESAMDENPLGFPIEITPQFKALVVYIEHRYYGKSIPFGSRKEAMRNASNLGYLSSAQALADYAAVILHIKKNLSAQHCPIIVFGGSYGGMLTSWLRLKYPHIALGALASSAPILYFVDTAPKFGYYEIVSKDFKDTSESCYETIRKSWAEIDRIAAMPNGFLKLSHRFKTCKTLTGSDELKNYVEDMYVEAAQYDGPMHHPVETICGAIDAAAKKTDILGRIFEAVVANVENKSCYVNEINQPQPDEDSRPWGLQTCTEIVMPIGIGKDTLFPGLGEPFDMKSYMDDCKNSYGVQPEPYWVATYYGAPDLKLSLQLFGSNIIFSNGLRDPYSAGGVLENISDTIVALTTVNGSHCLDLVASDPSDPEWLIKQRMDELEIIEGWIADFSMTMAG